VPTCSRCDTKVGPFSFRSFSKQTGRCNRCDAEVRDGVNSFIGAFREFAADGVLSEDEWSRLHAICREADVNMSEALYYARPDVLDLIHNAVALAARDAVITPDEEKQIEYLMQVLGVPEGFAGEVRETLNEYKLAQRARSGPLSPISHSGFLAPGEACHLEYEATYINTETKTLVRRTGRLQVTNQRIRFLSTQGSFDVELKKINGAVRQENMIYMEMAIKRGTGLYVVPRPMVVEALINRLRRDAHEQKHQKSQEVPRPDAQKTPHEVLNVRPQATREEVVAAYRQRAKLYHPDKVASLAGEFRELAERRMKEINAAYQQLTR
jgi:hypothetical protein